MIEIKYNKRTIEKSMLRKITPYLARVIRSIVDNQRCTLQEIAATIGTTSPRISELLNNEKYKHGGATSKILSLIIQGGIVTVSELQQNVITLTKDESDLLEENYSIYEDKEVRNLIIECKHNGVDYKKILRDALRNSH